MKLYGSIMKLVKLIVKNFRAIGSGSNGDGISIDIDDNNLIFLCGKNNSGKSSLLYAYDMFVVAAKKANIEDFHNKDEENEIYIEAWIKAENEEDREHQALVNLLDDNDIAKIRKTWSRVDVIGTKETYSLEDGWQAGGAGGFDTILQNACPTSVWIHGSSTPEDIVLLLQNLVQETVLRNISTTEAYTTAVTAIQNLEAAIAVDEYGAEVQKRLNDSIQKIFPNISFSIRNEEERDIIDLFKKTTSVEVEETHKPNLGFNSHGHGIRRQFILSAFEGLSDQLAKAKKPPAQRRNENFEIEAKLDHHSSKSKMLLIEEPELYLHPDAIRCVRDLIYSLAQNSEFQVLAATHAPILVDLSKPHTTLVRVTNTEEEGGNTYQVSNSLFDDEERSRMKMLNYFDSYVCEAFFADRIILVEGDTEAIAINYLLHRFKTEHEGISTDIHVVNCGSKMNIPFFQKILSHFMIPYWVLHDLDARLSTNGNANPAWTLNEKIWIEIEKSNALQLTARRFVFNTEFESGNGYSYNISLGKPYSAFTECQEWNLDDEEKQAVKFLRIILGITHSEELYSQADLEALAPLETIERVSRAGIKKT